METEYFDLHEVLERMSRHRHLYYKVLTVVFVVTCALVLCVPRTYTTEAKLVPEVEQNSLGGALGDMASMIGFDIAGSQTSDAITPLLYPDLMEDNGFVSSLFNVRVKSNRKGEEPVDATYYHYMRYMQKRPFWSAALQTIKRYVIPTDTGAEGPDAGTSAYNPYRVTKRDEALMEKIRKDIVIGIDRRTAVITIKTRAQDPYICQQLADSVMVRLQDFITRYRTNKARGDRDYYRQLVREAKEAYAEARRAYSTYEDANRGAFSSTVLSQIEELRNEMQLKYNNYTAYQTQFLAAEAKVQQRTPAFTILKDAAVPNKASSPKRMLIVLAMLFLAFLFTTLWLIKDDVKAQLKRK